MNKQGETIFALCQSVDYWILKYTGTGLSEKQGSSVFLFFRQRMVFRQRAFIGIPAGFVGIIDVVHGFYNGIIIQRTCRYDDGIATLRQPG
jgi:hypothetical protein